MRQGQGGIGLIQVMIALAGVAGITYTIMNQGEVENKTKVKLNFDQNFETHANNIRSEMADVLNCSASLAGKPVGTIASPTVLNLTDGLYRGNLNLSNQIVRGSKIFGIRSPGSNGIYIDSIQILNRPQTYFDATTDTRVTGAAQDILRIYFVSGFVDSAGVPNPAKSKGMGATQKSLDLPLVVSLNSGVIKSCYFDAMNSVKLACEKVSGAIWNNSTKKCELPNAISTSELIKLWLTKDGVLSANKPADAANGKVTCQKNSKRCSRTNMDCTLPACPLNHYQGTPWEWDRKQSLWDYACMKSANCMYVAQPAGQIIKP